MALALLTDWRNMIPKEVKENLEIQENKEKKMSKFSDKLKEMMKEKNIAAGQLADAVGVNPQTFMSWMDGSKLPYEAVRTTLCKALSCDVKDLFGGNEKSTEPVAKNEEKSSEEDKASEPVEEKTTENKPVETKEDKPVEEKPVQRTKKKQEKEAGMPAPVENKPSKKTQLSPNDRYAEASKELHPLPKPLGKNPNTEVVNAWVASLSESLIANIKILSKLAEANPTNAIPDDCLSLVEAAKGASKENIDLATTILKKCK